MPTSSSVAFYCTLCPTASIASATTAFSPMAPAVTASLSVVGCLMPVSRVPSTSLPTIPPEAIARSRLLTSPSVLIAVAPCGGSQPCHAPATLSHSPVTRHDIPTDAHRDRARSQSCGQRCRTGPARPINRSNLECRPFLPRRLTQLRRIDLDHRSRAQTSRSLLERSNQDPTSSPNKPSPLSP